MRHIVWLGLLIIVLTLATQSAYAQPACPNQPTNPDGTTITSPTPDQVVTSPFTIQGAYFGSFEGVVPIRILAADGTVLLETNAMNECCILSPYERQVSVPVRASTPACVVVYRESGADGSLTPLAQVPITLTPAPGSLPGTGSRAAVPAVLVLAVALALISGGIWMRQHTASQDRSRSLKERA